MNTTVTQPTDNSFMNADIDDQHSNAAPQPQQTDRPEWLPEKFNNAEELAKSYLELEKKFSGGQTQEQQTAEQTPAEQTQPTQEQVEQATGLNLDNYAQEYEQTGELSDKTYQELASKGLNKELVDSYIEGQLAIADAQTQSAYGLVGGEANYTSMMTWASQNLPEQEVTAFNNVIDGGDVNAINMAISGMYARYQSNAINEPNLMQGEGKAMSPTFRSTAEVVRAMQDPRYKDDEAYRNDVQQRLAQSNVFG